MDKPMHRRTNSPIAHRPAAFVDVAKDVERRSDGGNTLGQCFAATALVPDCLRFGDPEIFARRSCFKVRADPQPRDSGALGFKYFNNIIAS